MSCNVSFLMHRTFNTTLLLVQDAVTPLSESDAVDLVKDVFASATERDIYTVCCFSCT
jgi:hypothetical protein